MKQNNYSAALWVFIALLFSGCSPGNSRSDNEIAFSDLKEIQDAGSTNEPVALRLIVLRTHDQVVYGFASPTDAAARNFQMAVDIVAMTQRQRDLVQKLPIGEQKCLWVVGLFDPYQPPDVGSGFLLSKLGVLIPDTLSPLPPGQCSP